MRRNLLLALAAFCFAATAAGADAQRRPAAAQSDWTRTVVATPEGGFRVGNPNAPVKLVEYLSLACPHCAHFAAESEAKMLPTYVRSGRVSLEYRNYILNGPDLAAAVLTRCAPPGRFFAMSQELLRTQSQWLGRMQSVGEAQRSELRTLPPLQLVQRLVPLLGLDQVGARYGITPAAQRACLARQANLDRIETMQRTANSELGVTGTPTFFINGQRVTDTNVWTGIEPLLSGS